MTVPDELFRVLDAPTPHRFCLGLYLCEPLCLELFTTEALLLAGREVDRLLSPRTAERLRVEIARRGLLFSRGRRSDIWSERGQRHLREIYESEQGVLRKAAEGLLLPPGEESTATVIPILVSVVELIETRFAPETRSFLRPGLCLRIRADRERGGGDGVLFERIAPTDDIARAARKALDLLDEDRRASLGRVVVHLPEVMAFLPVHGGSATLAFAEGFARLADGLRLPSGMALTGSVDPVSGRVAVVAGIEEKIRAATESAFHAVCHPSAGDGVECRDNGDIRAIGIPDRDPVRFLHEARRHAAPWQERWGKALKAALFLGMCAGATTLAPLYDALNSAANAVGPWCDAHIGPGIPHDIAYAGAGIPLAILMTVGPLLLFLLLFLIAARQIDCLVNWSRRRRWGPDAPPVGPPRTTGERVAKTFFLFFFFWACWIILVAAAVPILALKEILPSAPEEAGFFHRLLMTVSLLVALFASLLVPVMGFRRLYDRLKRRVNFLR
ncbi:MAG: hypothetical protein A2Z34_05650 [Planctomycetes bacterium RBG_16_59_8]|nr:MAG: hypothetical protein A2Z34_05650 [Planctomycetes bacterium RBG_16_59_8]